MKNITIKLLLTALLVSNAGSIIAMVETQSKATAIKTGIYGGPESTNFVEIKRLISELSPADVAQLNEYDHFIDGTALNLAKDRKKQFGNAGYDEIITLLEQKGAKVAPKTTYARDY